ncbi:universal stress protein [Latilactobacillus fuchuensis]|uniref:Usp4 protein n=1 Tax=Latilactobacillus fuchuensis DSM 14340 = JCM 11249 TaxID=1423747 RepID=A0A0R1RWP0_9LACO|nr:universal stress protein [Latilactobacillus fuchuensis]KRL61249.1 usp4 protein [Latilactobacillus fuchuensis DSM 14340 = JCM 11249]
MLEYHNILVGLDGSELADHASDQAIAIAKRNQAKLFIAQIIPDDLYVNDSMTFPAASIDAEKKSVKQYLEQKVAFAKEQGVAEVQLILRTGSARRELALTIPAEFNIDLTILGISGKGAIERLLMGSVAQFVSIHSVSNVLLIKS